jgi:Zn-dependent membrane protease YugP
MPFGLFWDPTFIFLIPAMLLVFWAQQRVRSTFEKYSQVSTRSGVTAANVARDILDRNNLNDVPVEQVAGHLTDHYDPKARVIRLSEAT